MVGNLGNVLDRFWSAVLLIAWAWFLFGGLAFGRPNEDRSSRAPKWARIASSLVLVVASWAWFAAARGSSTSAFSLLVAVGMTFGALGDVFMAEMLPVAQPVVCGMGAFALGHVAYIAAMLVLGSQKGLNAPFARFGTWAAWLLVGAAGWFWVVFRQQRLCLLHWAALPYSLLLASTAGLASGLALGSAALIPLAIGGALVLVSDLILAARLFRGLRFPYIEDVIWLTYGPGQMLIVYSVGLALGL